MRRSRGELYISHGRLCVCVSVCSSLTAFPHYCTLVVHYWADLQSVRGFCCCDNIAPNAKCQRVLVFAICLVNAASSIYVGHVGKRTMCVAYTSSVPPASSSSVTALHVPCRSTDHSRALRATVAPLPRTGTADRHTWLQTVESGLAPLNTGPATAYRRAQNRQAWSTLVGTATSSTKQATR